MLGSLIIGAIVGWIAGKLMGLEDGLLRNIVMGIIGTHVGGFALGLVGFSAHGIIDDLIVGVVVGCLYIWLAKKILHGRRQVLLRQYTGDRKAILSSLRTLSEVSFWVVSRDLTAGVFFATMYPMILTGTG